MVSPVRMRQSSLGDKTDDVPYSGNKDILIPFHGKQHVTTFAKHLSERIE